MKIAITTCIVLMSLMSAGAAETWVPIARMLPVEGNYRFKGKYTVKQGFSLRFYSKASKKETVVRLAPSGSTSADWTGSPSQRQAHFIIYTDNLPAGDDPKLDIVLKVRASQWWIYLNNRPALRVKPPFALPATLQISSNNTVRDTRVRFQKVAPVTFSAAFMDIEEGTKALANWDQLGGTWQLHTVQQDALEQHTSKKLDERPAVATHSPNFYSLEGAGTGQLLTGYAFEDNYRIRASIHTGPAESGLVFYYQDERNYYTFGMSSMVPGDATAWLKLIRYSSTRKPAQETLAVVQVDMTTGQWIMPEVRVNNHRLTCYLDNRKVIDLEEHMPVGGRYGLYVAADKTETARFDDVDVSTVSLMPLPDLQMLRFHTIDSENDIYDQESSILQFLNGADRNPMDQQWIESSISGKPRWLAIGDSSHPHHSFSADFTVRSKVFDIGLLVGFETREKTYYRYRCEFDGERLRTLCEEVSKGTSRLLVDRSVPYSLKQLGLRHNLKAVTTPENLMKLYYNDSLVYVHPVASSKGASGVYLGRSTQAKISNFSYVFKPALEYTNKYEKNPVFVSDPFMKHWSSPEGEWFTDPATKETWHKSDFQGEFSLTMPWVPGSMIHLPMKDGKKESQAYLKATADGTLELYYRQNLVKTMALPKSVLQDPAVKKGEAAAYNLHYGDHAIWVTSGNTFLGVHHIKHTLKGSRVRVDGFKPEHLAATRSLRHNVYDALFTQALHDWQIGGGRWQVINRFECKPTFSHLNGENGDGPASLWSKHTFTGDFCVEFYVGLRHGPWYQKSGRDFNLTVMNSEFSPASGYTVTCSGWEPNEMQNLTRLYKNGELIKTSDTYTAPQVRSGNKRKLFDPIIRRGRDVHGAWYYIKLRRRGSKLDYFFDNEKILTWDDPEPIKMGSLGIWTYRNSMMVSRVKVSADDIQPTWFPIRSMHTVPPRPVQQERLPSMEITGDTLPIDIMSRNAWKNNQHESQCVDTWEATDGLNGPAVIQKSIFGGGSMLLEADLPMLPLAKVAGIRFSVKRTADTNFNFYYALHPNSAKGSLPVKQYMYHLSGSDNETPDWKISGSTDVPPLSIERFERSGSWTDVVVWFPTNLANPSSYYVKLNGFGNLNPSYIQQGLKGNKPGARYALSTISLVHHELPTLGTQQSISGSLLLRGVTSNRFSSTTKQLDQVPAKLAKKQRPGLNGCEIILQSADHQFQPTYLYWNHIPERASAVVEWHPTIPYAVRIRNPNHIPGLSITNVLVNKEIMAMTEVDAASYIGYLPVPTITEDTELTISYRQGADQKSAPLDFGKAPLDLYPVLTRLDGPVALLVDGDYPISSNGLRYTQNYIPTEGRHLQFQNSKYGERLSRTFHQPINLAHYPVMAFRYYCDSSAAISINGGKGKITFTEAAEKSAQTIRFANALRNETWNSWFGTISDLEFSQPFSPDALSLPYLQFGSTSTIDQTGRHSKFSIDNLVVGPVVKQASELVFTPSFKCPDGIQLVEYCFISGNRSYHDLTDQERTTLSWKSIPNHNRFTPDLNGLSHDVGRLILRAASTQGILSQPYEIPFMIDNVAPKTHFMFARERVPGSNGEFLKLTLETRSGKRNDGGAPVNLKTLTISADGTPAHALASSIRLKHGGRNDTLLIDWPLLLRDKLNKQQKHINLTIAGITDGAGNKSPNVTVPVSAPKNDSAPPTWLSLNAKQAPSLHPDFVFPWTDPRAKQPIFQGSRATVANYTHTYGKTPFVRLKGYKQDIYGFLKINPGTWNLKTHPLLSFAIRLPKNTGADDTSKFFIEVKGSGTKVVRINLPVNTNTSAAGDWQYFCLDIRKRFQRIAKKQGRTPTDNPGIWHIALRGKTPTQNFTLDIRDILIHNQWTQDDVISVEGYDASGISHYEYVLMHGATVVHTEVMKSSTLKPFDTLEKAGNADQLYLIAVDTKGNRSTPLRLPLKKKAKQPSSPKRQ